MATHHVHAEKPDMPISDMDLGIAELEVRASLQNLPGIIGVLLVGRGAFIRYNPNAINEDQICSAVRPAGYRLSNSQDSKTGQTGVSSH
jgi:hypothetical protein